MSSKNICFTFTVKHPGVTFKHITDALAPLTACKRELVYACTTRPSGNTSTYQMDTLYTAFLTFSNNVSHQRFTNLLVMLLEVHSIEAGTQDVLWQTGTETRRGRPASKAAVAALEQSKSRISLYCDEVFL